MIQTFRQIKNRIRGIENARKVTRAMELVSVTKLNRISKLLYSSRPYCRALESMLRNLLGSGVGITHPFLEKRPLTKKALLCVVSSDNGLCGLYNNNILRSAEEFINKRGKGTVDLITVGKRGFNHFKRKDVNILQKYIGLNGRYEDVFVDEISNIFINLFVSKKADEVYVVYMHFKTAVVQKAAIEKILNIEPDLGPKREIEYLFEPPAHEVLGKLLPSYIRAKMRLIFKETFTAEHAARTLAMRAATNNARELLSDLTLLRNKVRQASITQDMLEIISSAEALKG